MVHIWVSQKLYKKKMRFYFHLKKCFKRSLQKETEGKLGIATLMQLGFVKYFQVLDIFLSCIFLVQGETV